MTKQFELSAYGVEEMNKKELMEIEGGGVLAWIIIGLTALLVVLVGGTMTFTDASGVPHSLFFAGTDNDGVPIFQATTSEMQDVYTGTA